MTKNQELDRAGSTLSRTAGDEPIFILCGRDRLAPEAIDAWAREAERHGVNAEKVQEARDLAVQMRVWQTSHQTKIPD